MPEGGFYSTGSGVTNNCRVVTDAVIATSLTAGDVLAVVANDGTGLVEFVSPSGDITTDPAFDAKGDLIGGTGADTAARLAVGTNGQHLVADSGQATGLNWENPPSAATDTIFDVKGDLVGGTGADTAARLAVGSNGQHLVADSGEATGMKWEAPPTSGGAFQLTELLSIALSGETSIDVDCTGYDEVQIIWEVVDLSASDFLGVRVSTDGITFDNGATEYRRTHVSDTLNESADLTYLQIDGEAAGTTDRSGVAVLYNLSSSSHSTTSAGMAGDESGNMAAKLCYRDAQQIDTHIRIFTAGGSATMDAGRLRVLGIGTARGLAASTPNTNVQGVVNQIDVLTMTSMTANRDYLLPTTAAIGQIAGVSVVDGDPDHEILIKSGAAGDKIDNVDHSTNEFTRLFIAGERMVFECIDAAGPHWQVKEDARKPSYGTMYHATTWTHTSTSAGQQMQLDTIDDQRGGVCDLTGNQATVRRDGVYDVKGVFGITPSGSNKNCLSEVQAGNPAGALTPARYGSKPHSAGGSSIITNVQATVTLNADDDVQIICYQNDSTSEAISFNRISIFEVF